MNLFGTNYLKIRNEYLIPIVPYGIQRKNYEFWLFKDIITDRLRSFNKISKNSFEIEISQDEFFKSLYCEIQLFLNKSLIQYCDFNKSPTSSSCWSFVSLYYLSFFASTTFFRFLHRGYIFLDSSHIKKISDYSLAVYSSPINLDSGNYYFDASKPNLSGNIVLTLSHKGSNFHQQQWVQLESFLTSCLADCDSDESQIFNLLLQLFKKLPNDFQSKTRNKLNYKGESAIWEFEKKFPYVDFVKLNNDFLKELSIFDNKVTDNNQIRGTAFVSIFLMKYILKLYSELEFRSKFGKDFYRERKKYLDLRSYNEIKIDLE